MADIKISGLGVIAPATIADADSIPIVDVSDTTQGPLGSTKKVTLKPLIELLSGDVSGPASASDQQVALFDGTTGKLIAGSGFDETDLLELVSFKDTPSIQITAGNNLTWVGNTLNVTDIEVANIYVETEAELTAAVSNINTNYVGGNIYQGANITLTSDHTYDLTNIDIYGFNYIINNGGSDDGTDLGHTITISSGSPTFYNTIFAGTSTGATSITMSTQKTRPLFIRSGTTASGSLSFIRCQFSDVIGGDGVASQNDMISLVAIAGSSGFEVNFFNCVISSHNNSTNFTYDGASIGCASTGGNLYINVSGQRKSASPYDLTNSSLSYKITSTSAARTLFKTDGGNYLKSGSDATNERYLNLEGIPTTDPLQSGVVWNNSGVLTISAG